MKLLSSSSNLFTLSNSILLLLLYLPFILTCGYPGSPAHANIKFSSDPTDGDNYQSGTFATYNCDSGYDLLGPNRRVCSDNGTWIPQGVPFCVLNVAVGKAAMQSSTVGLGSPQKAVDGSTAESFHAPTCTMTSNEPNPWWYVNLLEPYLIQLVRIDFGAKCCGSRPATVIVRVGNSRPDLDNNPICNKFTGFIEAGAPLFLPCARPTPGAFVSVHLESGGQPLSICETFVYTDHALSIEQCPSFRDQPLGSTSTYNGKCYLFYNDKPLTFDNARRFCDARGGTLVDETSPALQGFLSWELYRRHRNDKYGQYWLGAVKDPQVNKWKWINGKEVQISFWSQPRTNNNCSRFDGTKGWLWADTNCNVKLHTVCSHRPLTCGRPEIPANATILFRKVDIGSMVEYRCGSGNLLVGPTIRTCLPTGFFSEYSPKCKYLECGFPASIANGDYSLVNKSRAYMSGVQYRCDIGHIMVGRSYLLCDIDGRWNGPPPRCEPIPTSSTTSSTTPSTTTSTTTTSTTSTSTTSTTTTSTTTSTTTTPAPPSSPFYGSTRRNNITPIRTYYSSRDPSRRPPQIALIPELSSTRPPSTTSKYLVRYTSSSSSASPPSSPPSSPSAPSSSSSPTYSSSSPSLPGLSNIQNVNMNTVTNNNKRITSPVYPTTLTPTTNNNNKKQVNSNDEKDNEIDDTIYSTSGSSSSSSSASSASTKSANVKATATTKLNMGGIIALGVFGGFVFLAAIVTIIIIIVRRFKNSRNSIDAQTISTFDSSGDQSGFYRNYKESWENLKYVRHANSYKPGSGLGRLDAFDTAYRNPRSRNGGSGNGTVGVGGLCNEGFRDTGEITLNADVAALYSRPDKRFRGQY